MRLKKKNALPSHPPPPSAGESGGERGVGGGGEEGKPNPPPVTQEYEGRQPHKNTRGQVVFIFFCFFGGNKLCAFIQHIYKTFCIIYLVSYLSVAGARVTNEHTHTQTYRIAYYCPAWAVAQAGEKLFFLFVRNISMANFLSGIFCLFSCL